MTTLKNALVHTFTGVATEREMFYAFLVIGLPALTLFFAFFHHVTI